MERTTRDGAIPRLIQNWAELAQVPASATHFLVVEVDAGCGWIQERARPDAYGQYLSTHTFYGSRYRANTLLLRRCGFNVTLANWDTPQR